MENVISPKKRNNDSCLVTYCFDGLYSVRTDEPFFESVNIAANCVDLIRVQRSERQTRFTASESRDWSFRGTFESPDLDELYELFHQLYFARFSIC